MGGNDKSGRKKTPTKIKLIKGTYRKDRDGDLKDQLDFPSSIPKAPDHLSTDAKVEYGRMGETLYKNGLLSEVDMAAFAAYCQCYGRWVEAEELMIKQKKEHGQNLISKTTNGNEIQNPLIGIINTCLKNMKDFLTEFGMTPASRAKVPKPKAKGSQEEQDWEKLG